MYVDALKPPSLLSLFLKVDIVQGITSILKSVSTLQSMVQQDLLQLYNGLPLSLCCQMTKREHNIMTTHQSYLRVTN